MAVARLPSLSRAKSLAEYSSAGYLVFAIVVLAFLSVLDWQAHAAAYAQTRYEGIHKWFEAALDVLRLGSLPVRHAPLVIVGLILLLGLFPVERVRRRIGELTADFTLSVLSGLVFISERLIRHRVLSSILLSVLAVVFAHGVYLQIRDTTETENAELQFSNWLTSVQNTITETTLKPEDAWRFDFSHSLWTTSISHLPPLDPRFAMGAELDVLIHDLYAALSVDHDERCGALVATLDKHDPARDPERPFGPQGSDVRQLHNILLARGHVTLVADCPNHDDHLVKVKGSLVDVTDPGLSTTKNGLLSMAYTYAALSWLESPEAVRPDLSALCPSLTQCVIKARDSYLPSVGSGCTQYADLKRANNRANFLEAIAAKGVVGSLKTEITWLKSKALFAEELRPALSALEHCSSPTHLGGYLAFLTLAQGYAALYSLLPSRPGRPDLLRSAAYLGLAVAISPNALDDSSNEIFCPLLRPKPVTVASAPKPSGHKSQPSSSDTPLSVFQRQLRIPTDNTTLLQSRLIDKFCPDDAN